MTLKLLNEDSIKKAKKKEVLVKGCQIIDVHVSTNN